MKKVNEVEFDFIALLVTSVVTLLSAFLGAYFAYQLNSKSVEREKVNEQAVAVSLFLFMMLQRLNSLVSYKIQIIDPTKKLEEPWLALRCTKGNPLTENELQYKDIGFLIHDKATNELMVNTHLADLKYKNTASSIIERSDLHSNILQPIMESELKGKERFEGYVDIENLKKKMGTQNYVNFMESSKRIISSVKQSIPIYSGLINDISAKAKVLFPNHHFITVDSNALSTTEDKKIP